jgi:hypothetical protein
MAAMIQWAVGGEPHHVVGGVVGVLQPRSSRTAEQWDGVDVSYGGVRGLVVTVGVRVCPVVTPRGV